MEAGSTAVESTIPDIINDDDVSKEEAKSALDKSIKEYGQYSYYYAHAKKNSGSDIDKEAKIFGGPGIITGGPPVLIASKGKSKDEKFRKKITKYMWMDDGEKGVKIYVDFINNGINGAINNDMIDLFITNTEMKLTIIDENSIEYMLHFARLHENVISDGCSFQVRGNKVVITLKKDLDVKWLDVQKK